MTPLRVGICGLGAAGWAFVPALRRHPGLRWVAAADAAPHAREDAQREGGVTVHAGLDEMLALAAPDAVILATPTPLHAPQALRALAAGVHVLVEKPMAAALADAHSMVAAARQAQRVLMVGHSHGQDGPIRRMRELIQEGAIGALRMLHTWNHTDWLLRPRRDDELDMSQGGGVTFRQGAHQFDILRVLAGGMATRIRAHCDGGPASGRVIGAHQAFIEFEGGVTATAVYNGNGGFSTRELCFGIGEWGAPAGAASQPPPSPPDADPLRAKRARARHAIDDLAPHPPFFGLTLVSGAHGQMHQSPQGLWLHTRDAGRREIILPVDRAPRDLTLADWHDAMRRPAAKRPDGRWGLATLELVLQAIASSEARETLPLCHQVAADD